MNTNFGTVTDRGAYIVVDGDSMQLYHWAHRPGAVWPCSALGVLDHVGVVLDARNGDLVDLVCDRDGRRLDAAEDNLTSDELTAWIDDCLTGTSFAHLRRFPAVS